MTARTDYALGIDLGTSGCKVVALDTGGHLLATAEARYPMIVPQPGWQRYVQDDGVEVAFTRHPDSLVPAGLNIDRVSLLAERTLKQGRHLPSVLDD